MVDFAHIDFLELLYTDLALLGPLLFKSEALPFSFQPILAILFMCVALSFALHAVYTGFMLLTAPSNSLCMFTFCHAFILKPLHMYILFWHLAFASVRCGFHLKSLFHGPELISSCMASVHY